MAGLSTGRVPGRGHHVAAIADAFLTETRPRTVARPEVVVAAPGGGATALVSSALAGGRGGAALQDLGDAVGARLGCWEREGLAGSRPAESTVLLWCVKGTEATSLAAALVLGRLAALYEPMAVTVLWLPTAERARSCPTDAERRRARRLGEAAVPRARVSVHCVGWGGDAAAELADLVARFA
ncbi:MAG: hypothetical protein R3D98_17405 [Candidatus Krumholzibacteriia bacterium]